MGGGTLQSGDNNRMVEVDNIDGKGGGTIQSGDNNRIEEVERNIDGKGGGTLQSGCKINQYNTTIV